MIVIPLGWNSWCSFCCCCCHDYTPHNTLARTRENLVSTATHVLTTVLLIMNISEFEEEKKGRTHFSYIIHSPIYDAMHLKLGAYTQTTCQAHARMCAHLRITERENTKMRNWTEIGNSASVADGSRTFASKRALNYIWSYSHANKKMRLQHSANIDVYSRYKYCCSNSRRSVADSCDFCMSDLSRIRFFANCAWILRYNTRVDYKWQTRSKYLICSYRLVWSKNTSNYLMWWKMYQSRFWIRFLNGSQFPFSNFHSIPKLVLICLYSVVDRCIR